MVQEALENFLLEQDQLSHAFPKKFLKDFKIIFENYSMIYILDLLQMMKDV